MGTWGTGIFESDAALDFVEDILETDDLSLVKHAVRAIVHTAEETLDADLAEQGLVAAEIIAALGGSPGDLPDELEDFLADQDAASPELRSQAHEAVLRVFSDSELRELWEEAEEDDFEQWQRGIRDLLKRLAG